MKEDDMTGFSRRELLVRTAAIGGAAVLGGALSPAARTARAEDTGPVTLPKLPYEENALEPVISGKTISFHYGKHHKAYVDNVISMTKGTDLEGKSLEAIVVAAAASPTTGVLSNNASQAWNHAFYWQSLKPGGGGDPTGALKDRIVADLGSVAECKKQLADAAKAQFGSGWAWLCVEGGKIKVMKTSNAENPLRHGSTALLTIDVWEHAYYLDYQNKRGDYVSGVMDKLINWEFAAKNLPA